MHHNNSLFVVAGGLSILLVSTKAIAAGGYAPVRTAPIATPGAGSYRSQQYGQYDRLSNYEFIRIGLEGWGISGMYRPAFEQYAQYTGGGGGLRIDGATAMNRYLVFDLDFRVAGSGYGDTPRPDMAVHAGWGFSGLRWAGKFPGSIVFGVGVEASAGRPLWLSKIASLHPTAYGRFMLKFTRKVRLQMDYRFSPVSTQLHFAEAWVMRHEAAIGLNYDWVGFGVRGRIEDVAFYPNYEPNLRALALGGFVALIYK